MNDRRRINHRVTEDHGATSRFDVYLPATSDANGLLLRGSVPPWLRYPYGSLREPGMVPIGLETHAFGENPIPITKKDRIIIGGSDDFRVVAFNRQLSSKRCQTYLNRFRRNVLEPVAFRSTMAAPTLSSNSLKAMKLSTLPTSKNKPRPPLSRFRCGKSCCQSSYPTVQFRP